MGRIISISLTAVFVVAASFTRAAAADITSWSLRTTVNDSSGVMPIIVSDFSNNVQNPFVTTQFAMASPTDTAEGIYDVSWINDTASFSLQSSLNLHGRHRTAGTSGILYFYTDVDLLFSVNANMVFASTSGDEDSFHMGFGLRDNIAFPFQTFFSDTERGGDFYFEHPASGTLQFGANDVLLPGGRPYRLSYSIIAVSSTTLTGQSPLTATTSLAFSWRPVPEPASAALFVIAAVRLTRRRRLRSNSTPYVGFPF